MPIKLLLLGGGVLLFLRKGGNGSANFIFMGVGIFPTKAKSREIVALVALQCFTTGATFTPTNP